MNYVRGFAPWLCYAALSALDWRLGMCAAAVASLVLLAAQLRRRTTDLLGAVTCAYFVVMAVIALVDPKSGLHNWTPALAEAALAITALGSLAVRKPFTLTFARTQVPEHMWTNPRFISVNMVITGIWAAAFAAAAITCALIIHDAHSATVALITVQVFAFVIPFVLGGKYADRAKNAARQHAEAEANAS